MKLMLTIEQRSKHVPYPADFSHGQSQNHGFRTLKSDLGAIEAIPEVGDCPTFREALLAINGPDTPFFSVGCEKSLNRNKGMWSKKGYLEFAFNCADRIGDAASYFPIFFHFNRSKATSEFLSRHPVQICWELQPAYFVKIAKSGFTCCVWITTTQYSTAAKCESIWNEAVLLTALYAAAVRLRSPPIQLIYEPEFNGSS
ncbi:hypothetical protein [Bradyrhizobium sp. AUGA SZCCT0042]|uniref:hypothetical protein n=1 Tax=Bradyrhizobium sp. AUGA SZCCT0042 TaxID=2807651 RepID=UPI001BAE18B7|nr:hypothetical protein [Bradyrhizobium sp. AUGA SZCCT0042]MBR1302175.1 hypothetical protein [Bradyrhizobium sp. AUGA SZCCT0042]